MLDRPTLTASLLASPPSYVFHLREGAVTVSSDRLLSEATARAAFLQRRGVRPGDVVGVLGPNEPAWVFWACGAWLAGAVLLPVPYGLRIRDAELFGAQLSSLATSLDCRVVAAHPKFVPFLPQDVAVPWDGEVPGAGSFDSPPVERADGAVLQLTSGSTSAPKGALLSQGAVAAGIRNLQEHLRLDPGPEVGVSWLPFFHDNGLFGHVLTAIGVNGWSHFIPTERFASRPGIWFRVASEIGATITSGPPSAWAAALRLAIRDRAGLDLSDLKIGMLSAETISPDTVDRLVEHGPSFGLDPSVLAGAYGMAEATLGLTIAELGSGIRVDEIDLRTSGATGQAIPERAGPVKRVASCGVPIGDVEVRIEREGQPVAERTVGDILVRTASLMSGYVGAGAEDPIDEHGWLRTGDLGYMADGELFVTGRSKDVIIVHGRNYAPEDIEWATAEVPGVRPGSAVAFAPLERGDGVLAVAVEAPAVADPIEVASAVRRAVLDRVGLTPHEVIVVPRNALPRTTSGKLQRSAVREAEARGELGELSSAAGVDAQPSRGPGVVPTTR